MLKNVNKWEEIVDKSDNCKEYHWKTISNEFIKWTKDGIFKEAFNTFLINNYFLFLLLNSYFLRLEWLVL